MKKEQPCYHWIKLWLNGSLYGHYEGRIGRLRLIRMLEKDFGGIIEESAFACKFCDNDEQITEYLLMKAYDSFKEKSADSVRSFVLKMREACSRDFHPIPEEIVRQMLNGF
jgi:hypothetical protein